MPQDSPFIQAIMNGQEAAVKEMIAGQPELVDARTESGLPAVRLALYYSQSRIARFLMEQGAKLDLFDAAALGEMETARKILDQQPDALNSFSNDGFQALHLAAFFGQPAIVKFLVERGAEVNTPAQNRMRVMPLHSAAATNQLEACQVLLEHGADPNARQADDFTPLQAAAQNANEAMIDLLLSYGADHSAQNKNGKTAYDFALESRHPEVAERLVL